jgi:hypothetical protein
MTTQADQAKAREERIRLLAYQIWEEEGQPEGKDEEHWQRASALVLAEENGSSAPSWLIKADAPAAKEDEAAGTVKPNAQEDKGNPAVMKRSRAL